MAITTTSNKSLVKVTVGTEAGTWGPYINGNQDLLDNFLGGTATIALTNSPVTLSSAQYQCAFIRFTGAITANVAITFPAVGSFYTIINDTTNSSNFIVTALTTAAGGRTIGLPPGNMTAILTDGVNARFSGLPPVGTYWDYGGSSVPAWVSACTIPPYLNCDGTTFSSATYPNLHAVLGGSNALPDLRGRVRAYLNQGTGRITNGISGIDGNTLKAAGGVQTNGENIGVNNLPNYDLSVNDPGHTHSIFPSPSGGQYTAGGSNGPLGNGSNTGSANTGITVNSGGSGDTFGFPIMQPTCIGGLTLIRGG